MHQIRPAGRIQSEISCRSTNRIGPARRREKCRPEEIEALNDWQAHGALTMGFESRDYSRDGRYTSSLSGWGMDLTPIVKYIIIANVVVFLLQLFLTRRPDPRLPDIEAVWSEDEESDPEIEQPAPKKHATKAEDRQTREKNARKVREQMEDMMAQVHGMRKSTIQEWFELDPKKTIQKGQLWRLLTSTFCHDRYGLWHIVFNMLLLYWFGQRLEQMYGSTEFLLFYLTAAICSSLAYVALAYYTGSMVPAIGASGCIMAVMMVYVIYYPFEQFLLFWFIPVPLWLLLGFYLLFDLHPVLLALAGEPMFSGVAHASHLGGLAFGYSYWKSGYRLEPLLDRFAPERSGARSRRLRDPVIRKFVPRDDTPASTDRVDEVLKKISEHGMDSLSAAERDILIEAAEKYRGEK
jgi:membrane associated rhomboid family serine protease